MATLGRRAARDVLLLPAIHAGRGDFSVHHPETDVDAPRNRVADHLAPAGPDQPSPSVRLFVRPARPLDALALSRFPTRADLNYPGSSRSDSDPVRATLRGLLPFTRDFQRIFVATEEEERRALGFAQFRIVGPDQRWLAESIAADAGVFAPDPVIAELLRHVIRSAGLHGAKRLFAHLEPDSPLQGPFRELGFAPFARQRIMSAPSVPATAAGRGVRLQEQADVWAIHQLYLHTTPREVQYAEALTSHGWDVNAVFRTSGHGCRGWIIADDYLAIAYARAISRRDAHVIEFMVSPDHRDVFPALISTVFRELADQPSRRVFVTIREYQSEYVSFLHELGFTIDLTQEALIRYTTATMRSSVMAANHAPAEAASDPAAKRVPTFYGGPVDTITTTDPAPDQIRRG